MLFNIGDLVSRNSYHNDIIFEIVEIEDDVAILRGVDVRLCADSLLSDLKKVQNIKNNNDDDMMLERFTDINLDRNQYFYIPGRITHLDSDKSFLDRCIKFYDSLNIKAKGIKMKENKMASEIPKIIEEYKPDILVITGHDAYYRKMGNEENNDNYKNTNNFINAVREARKIKSHNDLIIVAGACQSNYEELIKAGANFASSPKRVNIHALDPAIIASSVALSDKNKPIDLLKILDKTKYGKDGMGGIITNGTMYVGYPR